LINMLTNMPMAKVSIKPWKTQLLNYFLVNKLRYLVDLPWYGYAKYSKEKRMQRVESMRDYLINRETLKTVFLLIDWSITPQRIDLDFVYYLNKKHIPFEIIITKIDKCSQKDLHKNLSLLELEIKKAIWKLPKIFKTSNTKGRWRNEVLDYIEQAITPTI
jgi:GTP-binding protein